MVKGTKVNGLEIIWHGHAAFEIRGKDAVVYTDPYVLGKGEKADLILISHEHFDHCDAGQVSKIIKDGTVIVTTGAAAKKISGDVKVVRPGDEVEEKGVKIRAVHAYNPAKPFHPKGAGVGFVFTVDGVTFYHAGDTEYIPEMEKIKADVALLPIGGTYTMDEEQAAKAVEAIKPKTVVPMHYGTLKETPGNPGRFKELVGDKAEVRVLE